jgi:WD40 repeat protein
VTQTKLALAISVISLMMWSPADLAAQSAQHSVPPLTASGFAPRDVQFSPTDPFLLLVESPGAIDVLDTADLAQPRHVGQIMTDAAGFGFSHDGKRIVTVNSYGTIRQWTLDGTPAAAAIEVQGTLTSDLAVSPVDDVVALVATDHDDLSPAIELIDLATGKTIVALSGGAGNKVRSTAFSHDGRYIVGVAETGRIMVWNRAGQTVATMPAIPDAAVAYKVRFSATDRWLLSTQGDDTVRAFAADFAANPTPTPIPLGKVTAVAGSDCIAAPDTIDGKPVWSLRPISADQAESDCQGTIPVPRPDSDLGHPAMSLDKSRFAASTYGTYRGVDLLLAAPADGQTTTIPHSATSIRSAVFDPATATISFGGDRDEVSFARSYDLLRQSWNDFPHFAMQDGVWGIAESAPCALTAVGLGQGRIATLAKTGDTKATYQAATTDVFESISISPDCRWLNAQGPRAGALIPLQADGRAITTLEGDYISGPQAQVLSPDGALLYVAEKTKSGGAISVRDAHRPDVEITGYPTKDGLTTIAVAPNGKIVAAGGNDGRLYLYDVADGRLTLKRQTQRPSSPKFERLVISPDSALVAGLNGAGFLHVEQIDVPDSRRIFDVARLSWGLGFVNARTVWYSSGRSLTMRNLDSGGTANFVLSPDGVGLVAEKRLFVSSPDFGTAFDAIPGAEPDVAPLEMSAIQAVISGE